MSKKKVKEEPGEAGEVKKEGSPEEKAKEEQAKLAAEDSVAEEGSPTAKAEAELAALAEKSKPEAEVVPNAGDPDPAEDLRTPAAEEPAEDAKEEAPKEKAAPPTEPDVPAEESEEVEEELDLPGVVTILSKEKFLKLHRGWLGAGKPRRLNAFGRQWLVLDDGIKFVDQGAPGGMGDYGSLSTSSLRK